MLPSQCRGICPADQPRDCVAGGSYGADANDSASCGTAHRTVAHTDNYRWSRRPPADSFIRMLSALSLTSLFRRPLPPQQAKDSVTQTAVHGQPSRFAIAALARLVPGGHRPVIGPRSVTGQLPPDGRGTATQLAGHLPETQTLGMANAGFLAFSQAHALITPDMQYDSLY